MSIRFNHTLVWTRDKKGASTFLTGILGLPEASPFGPFLMVELENGVSLDFIDVGSSTVAPQHYAFLIDEEDFDPIFERIRARGLDYWCRHLVDWADRPRARTLRGWDVSVRGPARR